MYAKVIELKILENADENELEHQIYAFVGSLKNNGQILREYQVVKIDGGYALYVTTPKEDSLNEEFDSIYVKKYRAELKKYFAVTVTEIGLNTLSEEYCSCTTRTAMEMETYDCDIDSVFICCTCGKPIALYELPYIDGQDEHYSIISWQNAYSSTDRLWLECLSDRFTGNQLVNVNSALNKEGRRIANEIGRKTGIKVYYNVFDDLTKKVKFVKENGRHIRLCPCCGNPMKYVKNCDDYEIFVCDDCMLSSDLPNEE